MLTHLSIGVVQPAAGHRVGGLWRDGVRGVCGWDRDDCQQLTRNLVEGPYLVVRGIPIGCSGDHPRERVPRTLLAGPTLDVMAGHSPEGAVPSAVRGRQTVLMEVMLDDSQAHSSHGHVRVKSEPTLGRSRVMREISRARSRWDQSADLGYHSPAWPTACMYARPPSHRQVSSERCASEWRPVKCSDRILVRSLDTLLYRQGSSLSTT